jgi:hypothetical protein
MYEYLIWGILFGAIFFILFLLKKNLRKEMIYSGLLWLPFGALQPLFVPEYWNPHVLIRFNGLDIESFLWCFFIGGIAAVLYETAFNLKLKKIKRTAKSQTHAFAIYVLLVLGAIFAILIKFFTNFSVLRSSFVFALIILAYSFFSRRDLVKVSLVSGILFLVLYILILLFIDCLFPGFIINQWNFQATLGIYLIGIPLEEYIFAYLFGAMWAPIYEEIKNIKLSKK